MIGVIDYGMGNLKSVCKAIEYLGHEVTLLKTPESLSSASHLIVPGVGSFAQAMKNLRNVGLDQSIVREVKRGKPFLGICLGLQILCSTGFEHGETKGLNLVEGEVKLFDLNERFQVPHVGWNNLKMKYDHPVFDGIKAGLDFYFVHSFYFDPKHEADVLGTTDYGVNFASVVARDNIVGVQFHPEKSQDNGLKIIENFIMWDGKRLA